jgi:hypothetical protein
MTRWSPHGRGCHRDTGSACSHEQRIWSWCCKPHEYEHEIYESTADGSCAGLGGEGERAVRVAEGVCSSLNEGGLLLVYLRGAFSFSCVVEIPQCLAFLSGIQ